MRVWAEWLAVVSGTIYLPIEIYEVCVKVSFVSVFALVANIVVVGVVAYVLIQKGNQRIKFKGNGRNAHVITLAVSDCQTTKD